MVVSLLFNALHVYVGACIVLWIGEAQAATETLPSFNSTPKTVNRFQDDLSTGFVDRTALLLTSTDTAVGGTGSANARLESIECFNPPNECFPADGGEYIGVLEESLLPQVLQLLDVRSTAGAPSVPRAIIALPSSENISFTPAPQHPFVEYQPGGASGDAKAHRWNPSGADLLNITVPFGVFLAPREEASDIQEHTRTNGDRGANGAEYGSTVRLDTQIDVSTSSRECVPAEGDNVMGNCAPLGGYSVWASMPPQVNSSDTSRKQVLVLSHWDSQGLFRSIISGTHSAQSGLVTMLLAADILHTAGHSEGYERDLIFTSLAGEAFDLMASRKLLYDLQNKQEDSRAAVNLDGIDAGRLDAVVEVGMLGFDEGAYNGTGGRGGGLYVHSTAEESAAYTALVAAANATGDTLTVKRSSQSYLPPSSLLLWQRVLPDVDSVYLGDFDSEFSNQRFWDHNDDGVQEWSAAQVARSAHVLAAALHSLASGSAAAAPLIVDEQAVEAHAEELFGCLGRPIGLECDMVQAMMTPFADAAEQFVSVLLQRSDDEQDPANGKKNVERFVWQYLANRTHTGAPTQVADGDKMVNCEHAKHACSDGQVCLHEGGSQGGSCVTATVRFTPSHSTLFDYVSCGEQDESCVSRWELEVSGGPSEWASSLSLPQDRGWAETYNERISVDVNLRETASRDRAVLVAGICCTAAVLAVVLWGKAMHGRFKID